jgi:biopolymer transport protein ExbD
MLKRPSSRRKGRNEQIQLNLVPILDAMVMLIGFLLFTMSFLALVSIESPMPISAAAPLDEKVKERPLQLTLSMHEKDVEIWSPFQKFEAKTIPNMPDGAPDLKAVHDFLITIKLKFPKETKIVLTPTKSSNYETLIAVMDAVRALEPTDPPIFIKNELTGMDDPQKNLFNEVVFGNLLGVD